ncbi:unnamed protein product [Staurois parvus]|uniref:Fringe-like glycosyltransferase domain-containing protein n=1 Tax=Staurois parvus TaxID=386267 RepID=A0ABN9DAA2_9NEOB|nr:unnamed protein product [Staurois parvus]
MKISNIGLTKICFLLSVSVYIIIFLLGSRRQHVLPKPLPVPACNLTCSHSYREPRSEVTRLSTAIQTRSNHSQEWKGDQLKSPVHIGLKDDFRSSKLLQLEDLFIAVKTTKKYHKSRMDLLLQTWISQANKQTFIFTDFEDQELRQRAGKEHQGIRE